MRFDQERTFGVEIEFESREQNIYEILPSVIANLQAANVNVRDRSYTHDVTPYWKLVEDGSLRNGYELVSPILRGDEGIDEVARALNVLAGDNRLHVTRRCGLHVHHGASDLDGDDVVRLIGLYDMFSEVIDKFLAPSRRRNAEGSNQWARFDRAGTIPSTKDDIDAVSQWLRRRGAAGEGRYSSQRYHAVNINPLLNGRHTIEFRQHQGTLNADKATAWIIYTQGLMTLARNVELDFAKRKKIGTWNWMVYQYLRWFKTREYDGMDVTMHKAVRYLANRYSRTMSLEFPDREPDRVLYEDDRDGRQRSRRAARGR